MWELGLGTHNPQRLGDSITGTMIMRVPESHTRQIFQATECEGGTTGGT